MITTPTSPDSLAMRLITQPDENGEPLIPVIWLGQPCDECQRNKTAINCRHTWHHAPMWKDPERYQRLQPLWKFSEETNARENMGLASLISGMGFTTALIDNLRKAPLYDDRNFRPSLIYLAADPAAGGPSYFSITASYVNDGKLVVSKNIYMGRNFIEIVVHLPTRETSLGYHLRPLVMYHRRRLHSPL